MDPAESWIVGPDMDGVHTFGGTRPKTPILPRENILEDH
jgi:hypothetical protein